MGYWGFSVFIRYKLRRAIRRYEYSLLLRESDLVEGNEKNVGESQSAVEDEPQFLSLRLAVP